MTKFPLLVLFSLCLIHQAMAQSGAGQRCVSDGFPVGTEGNRLCEMSLVSTLNQPIRADLSRNLYSRAVQSEGTRRCGPTAQSQEWAACMSPLNAAYARFDSAVTALEVMEPPKTGTTCYPIGGGAFHCD